MAQQREKKLKCILLVGSKTNDEVMSFTDKHWQVVKNASVKRLLKMKLSKYKNVCDNLPVNYSEWAGFHAKCCYSFTTITTVVDKKGSTEKFSNMPLLRSTVETGIFNKKCLFCEKDKKGGKRNSLGISESLDFADTIQSSARKLNDWTMLTKTGDIDFVAKEVKYHLSCRRSYVKKADAITSDPATSSLPDDSSRTAHKKAFIEIADYVKTFII